MAQDIYTSSTTWVCPTGVTSVDVECWGGGAGGRRGFDDGENIDDGCGGGGGAYSKKTITVTPGSSYTVNVGAGGPEITSFAAASGGAGGDSYFDTSSVVMAKGGSSGVNTATGGVGGAAASGVGTTKYSGGNGSAATAGPGNGPGGGSSAGTGANGNNGSGTVGGSAPTGGGAGGTRTSTAIEPTVPGGGGYGGQYTGAPAGAGAGGKVVITYENPAIEKSLSDDLSLTQTITPNQVFNRSLSSDLSFSHEATGAAEKVVSDSMDVSHTLAVNVVRDLQLSDTLSLTEEVIPGEKISKSASSDLSLSHSVVVNQVHVRELSDDLEFVDGIDYWNPVHHDTYNSTDTWVCPVGVTSVEVECWGAGGGGGGSISSIGGGGGGGGAYSKKTITVTPGSSYTVTVGAGGTGGSAVAYPSLPSNATAGGASWFSTSGTIFAEGGFQGSYGWYDEDLEGPIYGNGGTGGRSSFGVGTTKYSGGTAGFGGNTVGGGGGSSAGTASNGTGGTVGNSGGAGGTAPTGGGNGGNTAVAGSSPGGGGGGGGSSGAGGTGAAGRVVISYTGPRTIEKSLSHTLSLSQTTERIKVLSRVLEDDFTPTHELELDEGSLYKQDTLELSQTVQVNLDLSISLEDSLGLSEEVIPGAKLVEGLSSDLSLSQSMEKSLVTGRSLSDTLVLSHEVEASLITGHFDFTSSTTWECPPGVASVTVECWGGGGGGGSQNVTDVGGGGGGGGGFSRKVISVTEGVTYTINVGAGGTGSTAGSNNATAGEDTWFLDSSTVLAKGGSPGTSGVGGPSYGLGGAGGTTAAGIGDTKYRGGAGQTGFGNGKGGSSGGTDANGLDGATGGSPPAGAGAGGLNAVGSAPGGGGGGRTGSNGAGYAGSVGKVTLIYVPPYEIAADLTIGQSLELSLVKNRSLSDDLSLSADLDLYDDSILKQDTMGLSQDMVANVERTFELEDTLAFVEDAVPGAVNFAVESDDLNLSESIGNYLILPRSLSDSLELSHSLVMNAIRTVSFSDSISFVPANVVRNLGKVDIRQEIILGGSAAARNLPKIIAAQTLVLAQSMGYSPRYETLSDTISLAHAVAQNLVQNIFIDSLNLSHSVTVNCDRTFEFADTLDLVGAGYRTEVGEFTHSLSMSHLLYKVDELVSVLALSHGVTVDRAKLVQSLLSIAHSVLANFVYNRSLSDTLTLGHSAIAVVGEYGTCTYNPISSVLPAAPTLTKAENVTYTCGVNSLVLRAPAIGDTDELNYQRILTETSGGTLRGFRQSTWPKSRILNFTFSNLECDEIANVFAFLKVSLGLQVSLVDYWGREWLGVIINPNAIYTEENRTTRNITIRFQGVLQ